MPEPRDRPANLLAIMHLPRLRSARSSCSCVSSWVSGSCLLGVFETLFQPDAIRHPPSCHRQSICASTHVRHHVLCSLFSRFRHRQACEHRPREGPLAMEGRWGVEPGSLRKRTIGHTSLPSPPPACSRVPAPCSCGFRLDDLGHRLLSPSPPTHRAQRLPSFLAYFSYPFLDLRLSPTRLPFTSMSTHTHTHTPTTSSRIRWSRGTPCPFPWDTPRDQPRLNKQQAAF